MQRRITKVVNSSRWDGHPFYKEKKEEVSTLLKVGCTSFLQGKKKKS
jgi:hypothetical protein